MSTKKLCRQPAPVKRIFDPTITQNRLSFILSNGLKWVNGTVIKYFFLEGAEPQKNVVRQAFQQWKDLGIGLSFSEVASEDDSMVRIGFDYNDGSWSYVGRDILTIPKSQRTMNFGWDLTADAYGMTTALHEIGHTLGFQHEHQSPFSGIVWNTSAVYTEFSGPPNNWPQSEIDANIINKLPANQLTGSTWDPTSIMEYQFDPGLVTSPQPYDTTGINPPGTLSQQDINGVKSFYPPVNNQPAQLTQNVSSAITTKTGGQNDYVFVAPSTNTFTFQTVGQLDSIMVVNEQTGNENHYLAGADDSGFDKNAKISLPLIKGRSYLINLRVLFAPNLQSGAIIVS